MHQIDRTTTDEASRDSRRRDDFSTLAPLAVAALVVAVVAIGLALSANQDAGVTVAAPPASVASDNAIAAHRVAGGSGGAEAPKADFTMPDYHPVTRPVAAGPKTFEMTASEKNIKVGDKVYRMWTFNGTVPGPTLRAVVGDHITVKIRNDGKSSLPHSIDYHASRLTLGGGHVQVMPGESGTFEFTVEYPGVFMYHCATAPVLHHIGMGMYGMLIVQPKGGFGPPMPEYALTQSELYATPEDIDENRPAEMAFNGIPAQYLEKPIMLPANSRVRLFVLNAGPSQGSSFHVVGTVFDRVLEDGNPRNASYGRQALALPSSGGGVFEMQLKGEGQFPFVTHQFNLAAKGAVGMLLAGDGKPGPGAVENAGANGHH